MEFFSGMTCFPDYLDRNDVEKEIPETDQSASPVWAPAEQTWPCTKEFGIFFIANVDGKTEKFKKWYLYWKRALQTTLGPCV